MCIRDSLKGVRYVPEHPTSGNAMSVAQISRDIESIKNLGACLLYTSDAADERSSVDLGGRRIIKKKRTTN